MAINVNFNPNVMLSGQVAAQVGAVEAQQRAFQNQMAMAQLNQRQQQINQQSYQFDVNSRLRLAAMRNQNTLANREMAQRDLSQRRGIAANFVSQQMAAQNRSALMQQQYQLNHAQNLLEHDQRLELGRLQEEAANRARNADYEQRKQMTEFQDELTKQRYEEQYSFKQEKRREAYQDAIDYINNGDFNDAEKEQAIRSIEYEMHGIAPSLVEKKEFPHGKDVGQVFSEDGYKYQIGPNGEYVELGKMPFKPELQFNPDNGAIYYFDQNGKRFDVDASPFDSLAERDFMESILKTKVSYIDKDGIEAERYLDPTKQEDMDRINKWVEWREGQKTKHVNLMKQRFKDMKFGELRATQDAINRHNSQSLGQPQTSPTDTNSLRLMLSSGLSTGFAAAEIWSLAGTKIGGDKFDELTQEGMNIPRVRTQADYDSVPDGDFFWNARSGYLEVKGQERGPVDFQRIVDGDIESTDEKTKKIYEKITPRYF